MFFVFKRKLPALIFSSNSQLYRRQMQSSFVLIWMGWFTKPPVLPRISWSFSAPWQSGLPRKCVVIWLWAWERNSNRALAPCSLPWVGLSNGIECSNLHAHNEGSKATKSPPLQGSGLSGRRGGLWPCWATMSGGLTLGLKMEASVACSTDG